MYHFPDGLLVDPNIPDLELIKFENVPEDLNTDTGMSYKGLSVSPDDCGPSLDSIDRPSGVLRVWFLLLEGMHSAAISGGQNLQPCILDMVFTDLTELIDHPGNKRKRDCLLYPVCHSLHKHV